ncbi:hypothetical protein ACP70R_049958 [Stipagrostis hirtigluma subsp. patula]
MERDQPMYRSSRRRRMLETAASDPSEWFEGSILESQEAWQPSLALPCPSTQPQMALAMAPWRRRDMTLGTSSVQDCQDLFAFLTPAPYDATNAHLPSPPRNTASSILALTGSCNHEGSSHNLCPPQCVDHTDSAEANGLLHVSQTPSFVGCLEELQEAMPSALELTNRIYSAYRKYGSALSQPVSQQSPANPSGQPSPNQTRLYPFGPEYAETSSPQHLRQGLSDEVFGVQCDEEIIPLSGPFTTPFVVAKGKRPRQCANQFCATQKHRPVNRVIVDKVCDWLLHPTVSINFDSCWVMVRGEPKVKISGRRIVKELLGNTELDVDMCDAIVHLFRELEMETFSQSTGFRPRHFISPEWGLRVGSGKLSGEDSLSMFTSTRRDYPLSSCTTALTLTQVNKVWCCYAIDFIERSITILDPQIVHADANNMFESHGETTHRILSEALMCMRVVTSNPSMAAGPWHTRILTNKQKCFAHNTAIVALNSMRWFNGYNVCYPPSDSKLKESRRELAFLLLRMEDNRARYQLLPYLQSLVRSGMSFQHQALGDGTGTDHNVLGADADDGEEGNI